MLATDNWMTTSAEKGNATRQACKKTVEHTTKPENTEHVCVIIMGYGELGSCQSCGPQNYPVMATDATKKSRSSAESSGYWKADVVVAHTKCVTSGRVLVVDHKLPPSKPVLSPLSVKRRSIAGSGMRTIWEEPASERVLRSASATLLLCHLSSSMGYSCLCTCHVCNKSVKYLRSCAHSAGHLLTHRLRLQMSCTSRRETRHWLFCTVMGVG